MWTKRNSLTSGILVVLLLSGCSGGSRPTPSDRQPATAFTGTGDAQTSGVVLEGDIGSLAKWGSAWIDLATPRDFKKGERLRLTLGGSGDPKKKPAEKVLVRLLRKGDDPNLPVGILTPSGISVPG